MRRFHLFELEDQPWFPPRLRTYLTDCLQRFYLAFLDQDHLVDRFAGWLRDTGARRVLDLCSGSSGPWLGLADRLADRHGLDLRIYLSDLYPDPAAFAAKNDDAKDGAPRLEYLEKPVDARRPDDLSFRPDALTIFAGLHHFHPGDARAILESAARRRLPIAVIEPTERSLRTVLLIPFLGPVVWLLTPWLRPRDPRRFFWTYLVPIVPIGVVWDGIVSCLRAYTVDELRAMTEAVGEPGYRWQVGQDRLEGLPARVTWVFGSPEPRPGEDASIPPA